MVGRSQERARDFLGWMNTLSRMSPSTRLHSVLRRHHRGLSIQLLCRLMGMGRRTVEQMLQAHERLGEVTVERIVKEVPGEEEGKVQKVWKITSKGVIGWTA